jgi:hypothetical protein
MELAGIEIGPSPERAGWTRLTGDVRYGSPQNGRREERYWFDFPDRVAASMTDGGDPWLACLLPVAVELGEPLVLRRPVDPTMLDSARERMAVWHWWNPSHAPVAIEADLAVAPSDGPGRTASLFSGGVDSFYTVLTPRAAPIDDLLVIHGAFDLMHAKREAFDRVQAKLQRAADALGKVLIPSATNLLHTRLGASDLAGMSQGSMMVAVPLALERRFGRVFVPASIDLDWHDGWGTHPVTDAMLSTSRTAVVEHGVAATRLEKTVFVARSDIALAALRVCLFTGDETNCMRCEKCLRTAIVLDVLGVIDRAPAFATRRVDRRTVRRMPLGDEHTRVYYRELLPFCREHARPDFADAIAVALRRARLHDPFRPLVRRLRQWPVVGAATRWLESRVHDPGVTWHLPQ